MGDEERRERRREYNRRYNERHPERRKESLRKYNNKKETKERFAIWVENNYDKYVASKNKWAKNNIEYYKNQTKKYREEHPGWMADQCAKRRSKKLNATPSWLSEDDLWLIKEIYSLASLRTKITGIKWVVDHIIPLQNKQVCGLHSPNNLRVITSTENQVKGNKFCENFIN